VDDIEAIIDASKHFKYHETRGTTLLNRISYLPESKRHLKMAIRERMQLLVGAYISLATFIDDDLVDLAEEGSRNSEEKIKEIYRDVIVEMDKLRKEMEEFKPTELST
jgi:2-phospho-L-lactate guanylyltransferase (CobY/MobA/RfbA family)